MGRRILPRHIWGYSVCLCPIKKDVRLTWAKSKSKMYDNSLYCKGCIIGLFFITKHTCHIQQLIEMNLAVVGL